MRWYLVARTEPGTDSRRFGRVVAVRQEWSDSLPPEIYGLALVQAYTALEARAKYRQHEQLDAEIEAKHQVVLPSIGVNDGQA